LVPDPPDVLTSNAGWDTRTNLEFLKQTISRFKAEGIRTSIFLNPDPTLIESAAETGTDRIELYTELYAANFYSNKEEAIKPYIETAEKAIKFGLGVNAGHDLDLFNLKYFAKNVPGLLEVSIGHALICDALEFGMANTVKMYLNQLA
jgi:pyridoxine 5-phosphate synthase